MRTAAASSQVASYLVQPAAAESVAPVRSARPRLSPVKWRWLSRRSGRGPLYSGRVAVPWDLGEGSYTQLQARSREQLAFVNNLLITLALAVLAFAAGQASDPSKLSVLGWRRYVFGAGLVLLAMSLLAGLWLALNRLQVFRIDARIARLKELNDKIAPDEWSQLDRIAYISGQLETWANEGRITRRKERRNIANPAQKLALAAQLGDGVAPDPETIAGIRSSVEKVTSMLGTWSDKGDVLTWRLFRVQTLSFLAVAVLMLITIMAYFIP